MRLVPVPLQHNVSVFSHRFRKAAQKTRALFTLRVDFRVSPAGLPVWWARRDSNPQPRDYESPALTVELQALQ